MGNACELDAFAGELANTCHDRRRQAKARRPRHTGTLLARPCCDLLVVAHHKDGKGSGSSDHPRSQVTGERLTSAVHRALSRVAASRHETTSQGRARLVPGAV